MKEKVSVFVATWFYSGFIPPIRWPIKLKGMAGTYGSFFSLPLCILLYYLGGDNSHIWYGIAIVVIFIFGLTTVSTAEQVLGSMIDWHGKTKSRDQNQIVIDETLGMLITCYPICFVSVNNIWLVFFLAFALFRVFDIVKIPPTRYFDRMKSAFGVMMDDVIAGIYAAFFLWLIVRYTFI